MGQEIEEVPYLKYSMHGSWQLIDSTPGIIFGPQAFHKSLQLECFVRDRDFSQACSVAGMFTSGPRLLPGAPKSVGAVGARWFGLCHGARSHWATDEKELDSSDDTMTRGFRQKVERAGKGSAWLCIWKQAHVF